MARLASGRGSVLPVAALVSLATLLASVSAAQHAGQYDQVDVEYGARLYAGHCVACHGQRGDALPGVNLRTGVFSRAPTDRELSNLIRDGIAGTAMAATGYTDAERSALVAYLRNMDAADTGGGALGDPARGRALFEGEGGCTACHRVRGKGPRAAPDLSSIGATRTAATLRNSLLAPSEALLPINRPVVAVTVGGEVIEGRRVNEDTFTVQLVDKDERLVSLEKARLREYRIEDEARMPSYAGKLTEEQVADLLAYLLSLKGSDQ